MVRDPMIFVNLPVSDLAASKRFLEAIGATNEPKFTDETAAMMRFSEAINVMLRPGTNSPASRRARLSTRMPRAKC